ncbi:MULTISPECIES: anti-repressor SinI family protein [unclassified Bacillus (in: firmicutes)]|jgi:DNA-binding transcriptional MerR regulator|nr:MULTISPECIES: anti-repressor SinI family protein [unclassified Bacillus (in: firmicutes)]MBT2614005.1 anti-repressor SinI family protein [Bacillus sp. ISL-78]MBT2629484.1 anti-repressor SinI family protein [Bacillus sp. ISL-101]MBT2718420.1 anti-repressor SinI family protein [Bacillus sp. ISL-57]
MNDTCKKNQLDEEWISLIIEAKELGVSIDEIREFIQSFNNAER